MHIYVSCLQRNAVLLLSGFYKDDIEIIEQECLKFNLKLIETIERNHWVALKFIN